MIEEVKQEPKQDAVTFNSGDLVAIQNIIDLASRRGAFAASESSMVGAIYDKLKAFNDYVAKTAAELNKDEEVV
jgi:hypothetical protein